MRRVFLDANVFIGAARAPEARLKRLWRAEGVELVSSEYVRDEVMENATEIERHTPGITERLVALMADVRFRDVGRAGPPLKRHIRIADDDDVPVLRGAIALHAHILLTSDREAFGRYYNKTVQGVKIMHPRDLYAELFG